jgi:hypothetical protein
MSWHSVLDTESEKWMPDQVRHDTITEIVDYKI